MKILLLTTLYSLPGDSILNNTNVCGSFAKEWVKMGHEVRVIYQYPIYHKIFHFLAKIFERLIANLFYGAVTTKRYSTVERFDDDGVKVLRIPLYKFAPRFFYPKKKLQQHIDSIIEENQKDVYKPDVIIGHFFYPNIEVVARLKMFYKCKGIVTVHYQGINIDHVASYLKNKASGCIENIDAWGYRSYPIKSYFERAFAPKENSFFCYSGVPSHFFSNDFIEKDFGEIKNFVYVGALIERKHPLAVVEGLYKAQIEEFFLEYVGDGRQRKKISAFVEKKNISKNVRFAGYVKRTDVVYYLQKAQVFIMISHKETFGLVYLEAMAKGCIVIASRGEGMEGIIKHGKNGFLCGAGNSDELSEIISQIKCMPQEKIQEISRNAYKTACGLTDYKVACQYIDSVKKICKG